MKLCNIKIQDALHLCLQKDGALLDLTAAGLQVDMNTLIALGQRGRQLVEELLPRAKEVLGPVCFENVTKPEKIVCVGLNYADHIKETGIGATAEPTLFSKFSDCLSAHGQQVALPPWRSRYDYEAELVIVIGKEIWGADEEEAAQAIFGYTCGNDLSARDAQKASSQWLIGKAMPGFAPAGPFITTSDEFDPKAGHAIQCRRNGELVQDDDVKNLLFPCEKIVSYASHYFRLRPGDLIFTGTPEGTIIGMQPRESRRYLTAGEQVDITIEGLGTLTTKFV